MQPKKRHILFLIFSIIIGNSFCFAQDIPVARKLGSAKDSLQKKEVVNANRSIDTVKIDSVKLPKRRLESLITDKSKDYKDNDFVKRIATLYNKAELYYQDIELKSGIIVINYAKNLAYARGIIDSLGNYTQRPIFKQGNQESAQDSLIYNFKSKKAVIYNVDTEQEGMFMNAQKMKRENDSTIFMNKAEITTDAKKIRDYYIRVNNIKVMPNKKAVGGLSQLYIADVPTPVIFPFFYVPLVKGRASGLLLPTWGDNSQGYFLQNGGFYFVINNFVDLAVTGDVYTNGSWGLRFDSSYKYRYKFGGRFSLRFENLINGQRGLSNYSKSNTFNISWSHNQDSKASPNSNFSANVNFGTSKFYRQSLNELNSSGFLNNRLSSSISYSNNLINTPFSVNIALTHQQNTNTEEIDMSLPNLNLSMERLFPFAPKNGSKRNPIHNIGLTYSMSLQNNITTNDTDFLKSKMFDHAKSGLKHDISLSTNMKAFKYLTITPSVNYKDVWNLKTIRKTWNPTLGLIKKDTINGFETYRTFSAGVSASTTLYGNFNFNKGRLKAIRHTIKPSVSYGYTPDFSFYYDDVQSNINGDIVQYSKFDESIFRGPSKNLSKSLNFTLRNLFEAKVKDRDSTKTEYKKITLLNNLNISSSYNMALDSLKWSSVRMSASTLLFKSLNLNFRATLDPYAINASGKRYNTYNINNGGSLFRLTGAGLTASYSLSDAIFSKKENIKEKKKPQNEDNQFGNDEDFGKRKKNKKDDKIKEVKLFSSTIPWKLSLNYQLGYNNANRQNELGTNTLRFNGSVALTPKWDITYSSGYDFKGKGLSYTRLGFARDLDSWRMNFSWTPFGNNASYYFFIGVKASTLSDLKYDQRKVPDRRLY